MCKEFLLGELYDEITDKIYDEKMKTATEYEKIINTYLNDIYDNPNSKMVQYNLYKQNILFYEQALGKYLYNFNIEELNNLISSVPSNSSDLRSAVFGFCNQYLDWCVYKNLITINNMKALDREELTKISKKASINKIFAGDKFYNLLSELEKHTAVQNFISLVLAKIGLMGIDLIEIRSAKYSDIDRENMIFRVCNDETGEIIKELKITDRDLIWLEKAREEDKTKGGIPYNNGRYIIKTTGNEDKIIEETAIYSRINNAFTQSNLKRISFKTINRSAKIEEILNIRENRKITTNDIHGVALYFEPEASRGSYNSLKKLYESVSDEKVMVVYRSKVKEEDLEDNNSKKFVENLRKELGIIESK